MNGIIKVDGHLFYDEPNNAAGLEVPKGTNHTAIFTSSMWVAGKKAGDTLVYSAIRTFGMQGEGFVYGPVADNYGNAYENRYNRVWAVERNKIEQHRKHWEDLMYQVPQTISDWPAHGDTTNGESFNLAPFVDYNQNGIYDPENGDYPCIKGDEAVYVIYNSANDSVSTLELEVHLMAYAFASNDPVNNTIFLEYNVINKSNSAFEQIYFGNHVDFDLGNSQDDAIGCDTTIDLYYCYNGDNLDENIGGYLGYGGNPGAIGIVSLNKHLTSFMSLSTTGPMGYPKTSTGYYNYMRSIWRDGSHLVKGGIGHNSDPNSTSEEINFAFPGEPIDTMTWTQISGGVPPRDVRGIASIGLNQYAPGDKFNMEFAVVYARNHMHDNINNVADLKNAVTFVRNFYDTTTSGCSSLTTGISENSSDNSVLVSPNPVSDKLSIKTQTKISRIELYNTRGALIKSVAGIRNSNSYALDVSQYDPGLYMLKIQSGKETLSRSVIIE